MARSALEEVRNGLEGEYLLPFFWQHGADEETLRNLIKKIYDANMRQICVESRPHPDFCGPRWWHDMDIILDEAQRRKMRVWVLDDKQFPTGFAGGLIEKKYPQHRRRFLDYYAIDAMGPDQYASFLVDALIQRGMGQKLEAVVAARRLDVGEDWNTVRMDIENPIDLTDQVRGGRLSWPVPEGLYTIFVIYSKFSEGLPLLNPISYDAVACQIEGCYQPHFEHYAHLFGTTFAGFFSDEPQFANGGWNAVLGTDMPLPWSDEMREALTRRLGKAWRVPIPYLWVNGGEETGKTRYAYMDELSRLYGECFSRQIGDWCHAHNVLYIGHQVEDNNAHSRLGPGTGHYFRGQMGQDMAGMDIVMHQIHPGYDRISRHWHSAHSMVDGEFFHYALAKLTSSMAHIDPIKQGRALCENFGAYGWMEGVRLMKWLIDHCLVRGINRFTPHAFTDSAFPEWDSPPHFFAQGNNPQYRFMGHLFRYANRMCHLFSGGRHVADAAVLYQADAEWSGETMLSQKPMRELMTHQIDFDVVPCDAFNDLQCVRDGHFFLGEERYHFLVIPGCEALPEMLLRQLERLEQAGVIIYFADRKPSRTSEGGKVQSVSGKLVPLEQLVEHMLSDASIDLRVEPYCPRLRIYHYINGLEHFFFFFNEEKHRRIDFRVNLPVEGPYLRYDAMNNRIFQQPSDGHEVIIALEAYEGVLLVAGREVPENTATMSVEAEVRKINGRWKVSTATVHQYPDFHPYAQLETLVDINAPDQLPAFTGTIRYETDFCIERIGQAAIRLSEVYETAEVWLNGQYAGLCISTPYVFDVTGALKQGENKLVIEVTNTLAKQEADFCSAIVPQEPGGMLSAPELIYWEDKHNE